MKLIIEIETDNAAFDHGGKSEVKRMIEETMKKVASVRRDTGGPIKMRDINGNTCGTLEVVKS